MCVGPCQGQCGHLGQTHTTEPSLPSPQHPQPVASPMSCASVPSPMSHCHSIHCQPPPPPPTQQQPCGGFMPRSPAAPAGPPARMPPHPQDAYMQYHHHHHHHPAPAPAPARVNMCGQYMAEPHQPHHGLQQPMTSPAAGTPAPPFAQHSAQGLQSLTARSSSASSNTCYAPCNGNTQPHTHSPCATPAPQQPPPPAATQPYFCGSAPAGPAPQQQQHQPMQPQHMQTQMCGQTCGGQAFAGYHGHVHHPGPGCSGCAHPQPQPQPQPQYHHHGQHQQPQPHSCVNACGCGVPSAPAGQTEIQCQDISQSTPRQKAVVAAAPAPAAPVTPAAAVVPAAPAGAQMAPPVAPQSAPAAAGLRGMRQDTYQRTLEYVQQCQSWADRGAGAAGASEPVTSSTHPPKQAATAAPASVPAPVPAAAPNGAAAPAAPQSNMVINDMTSSLTSLLEENRYFQMIQ